VKSSGEQSSIALVERVTQSQGDYEYAPDRRGLGLYGVAAYESGRYRVSQNVSQILKKNDPRYLLGHQLDAWSSMKLKERERVEKASQQLASLDTDDNNYDAYRFMEAIAAYELGDYARSIILFDQLENSIYEYESVRYRFLIALDNEQSLDKYIKEFE
jgi:tetratricopeptide (TPR) repeat protein